jgi:DNA ligase-1
MSRINVDGDLFSAQLFPNEAVGYDVITKPYMSSIKLDGFRCIFKNGRMISRSFKEIPNKQLQERFESMKKLSVETGLIYDGEIYSKELTFQQISHFVMSDDLENEPIPNSLKFNCFDIADMNNPKLTAMERFEVYKNLSVPFVDVIEQRIITTPKEAEQMFLEAVDAGYEGLILKDPKSVYKYGRLTTASGSGFKFKPFVTLDAVIEGIEQATKVDPTVERTVNELGYHKTSHKKNDRIPINKASAFLVDYEGKPLKVTIAMSDVEKEYIWEHQDEFIGKWVEYKAMMIGTKDLPRHPNTVRMRPDKDLEDKDNMNW